MQTQQPKQREDWRRRREKYLRELERCSVDERRSESGDASKDWSVIVGRGERGALERHAQGVRLFLVRTERAHIHVRRNEGTRQAHSLTRVTT